MRVALGSIFRDSFDVLSHYYAQVNALSELLAGRGDTLRILACENDSQDGTYLSLERNLEHWPDSRLVKAHDDCPYYPSAELPERWRHIAWVCNHVLELVEPSDDVFVYVESDLRWEPTEMLELVDIAVETGAVTAPCYAHVRGGRYYDTWGSRKGGARFSGVAPYHPDFAPGWLLPVDTCASVLATTGTIAQKTRFTPEDCFVGWSEQVREENGGSLLMATDLAVVHP